MTATDRISAYLDQRSKLTNTDIESIHGLHFGSEQQAELKSSDIQKVLADNNRLREAIRKIVNMTNRVTCDKAAIHLIASEALNHEED